MKIIEKLTHNKVMFFAVCFTGVLEIISMYKPKEPIENLLTGGLLILISFNYLIKWKK